MKINTGFLVGMLITAVVYIVAFIGMSRGYAESKDETAQMRWCIDNGGKWYGFDYGGCIASYPIKPLEKVQR